MVTVMGFPRKGETLTPEGGATRRSRFKLIAMQRALKDLNPRHPVLETDVLPTELRTLDFKSIKF